jgi:hypothetical protein
MRASNQAAVVAALLLVSSAVAGAQGHASHHAGSPVSRGRSSSSGARAGTRGATSSTTGMTTTTATSNAILVNTDSPLTVQQLLNPVPGLGFDFSHLAAVNRNLDVQSLIDPLTRMRLAQAERLLQETPVVTPVFFGFGESAAQPIVFQQPPPQIIVIQQPAPQPVPAVEAAPAPEPVAAPAPEPLPDAGQFILVLRDGSQITAVAFSRQDSRIVYITPDGSRRSLAISGLDVAATIRINEEHGTSLQLPL